MTHLYDEPIDSRVDAAGWSIAWRDTDYRVQRVLGQWASPERPASAGEPPALRLYRVAVESADGPGIAEIAHLVPTDEWRMKRLWN
ncbi:hypothetical protein [Allonocardiopsis opalescens]|uniref:hypothetical protein n=1 Tax=Allonocardiopsis opalescens TaxID=1144618 RepID=UPI0011B28507|nr:hypothetical protein [Allonocardiopsis opalescens]